MKCPCCKYEQKDAVFGYLKIEKTIKSGKRKGEVPIWGVVEQPIGDALFEEVNLVATTYSGSFDFKLHICPKCGVAFKEVL